MTDTKPTISNLSPINVIDEQKYKRYLPTAFDDSMSLLEKMNRIIYYVNNTTTAVNSMITDWTAVNNWVMGDGLTVAVDDQLNKWEQDGTMDTLINQQVFGDINNKLTLAGNDVAWRGINVKAPFGTTLTPAIGDGVTDDTVNIQAILDYAITNGINIVFIPSGTYKITATLTLQKEMTLMGEGWKTILDGNTGDNPVIARKGFTDVNIGGHDHVTIRDMVINDNVADRQYYYTVDLSNGHSCVLNNVNINAQGSVKGTTPLNAKYGALLGKAFGSTYSGDTFLAKVINCRLSRSKLVVNTTDWYILNSELWGNERDFAVMITGGGFIGNGTQIVGGETYGCLTLHNENNYDIETLKVVGVYFDGSYPDINSGAGITSYGTWTGALRHSVVVANTFWHQNKEGIKLAKAYDNDITGNTFNECDSDDTGESDIVISSGWGNIIINKHFRDAPIPKVSGSNRSHLSPVLNITVDGGFPYTTIGGSAGFNSTYQSASYTGKEINVVTSDPLLQHTKMTQPSLSDFRGLYEVSNKLYFNTPTKTINLAETNIMDAPSVNSGDCNAITTTQYIYIPDILQWTNYPSAITGSVCVLKTYYVASGYSVQEMYSYETNVVYHRKMTNNVWEAWQ